LRVQTNWGSCSMIRRPPCPGNPGRFTLTLRLCLLGLAVACAAGHLRAECARTPQGARSPGPYQLGEFVRELYPSFASDPVPERIVVGFVLDSTCVVIRHSAGFEGNLRGGADEKLRKLFPTLRMDRVFGTGISDIPPEFDRGRQVVVVWAMIPAKAPQGWIWKARTRATAHSAIAGPKDSLVRVSSTSGASPGGASHASTPAPVQCTHRTLPIAGAAGGRLNPASCSNRTSAVPRSGRTSRHRPRCVRARRVWRRPHIRPTAMAATTGQRAGQR
jgi:hypothetical protein